MKLKREITILFCFLLSILCIGSACAEKVWICSITDGIECLSDGTVGKPNLGELDPVTFFRVDTKKMQITLLAPESRRGEVTSISTAKEEEGLWILTGIEKGRAWSMVISTSGNMSLSITYDGITWSIFGNAMVDQ
jgi:hypothetical protein